MKLFEDTLCFYTQEEWKICELCCGEKERAAALSMELQAPLYGSHFVFFPALPNMELQSCKLQNSVRDV